MPPRQAFRRTHGRLIPLLYASGLLIIGCALLDRLVQDSALAQPPGHLRTEHIVALDTAPTPASRVAAIQTQGSGALDDDPAQLSAATGLVGVGSALQDVGNSALPESEPATAILDVESKLIATSKFTGVFRDANSQAPKLGYLRSGAVLQRSAEAVGFDGCRGGWYRVEPGGYVCVGEGASLDVQQPLANATATRPDRTAALPYNYGRARNPAPHFYTRVPTAAEQAQVEPDLHSHLRYRKAAGWAELGLGRPPEFLSNGQSSLRHSGNRQSGLIASDGQAVGKSGFALLSIFESTGRAFGVTTDLAVVPLDRLDLVKASQFHGLPLTVELTLPVVFNQSKQAFLYEGDPLQAGLQIVRPLANREVIAISGRREKAHGQVYLQTQAGQWIIDRKLRRVDPQPNLPAWATQERLWIDISIENQTLVAYQGEKPVFVTLVSTGIDGMGDPASTHSTIQGRYLIHTKHVSVTMDGDEVGDEYDLRDVPYVQYFHGGYALHGVYWHDAFGSPHSHGCVNLSPLDARWLFGWTTPSVPSKWHGAMSLRAGTLVSIHP